MTDPRKDPAAAAGALRGAAAGLPAAAMSADLDATASLLGELPLVLRGVSAAAGSLEIPLQEEGRTRTDDLEQRIARHGAREAGRIASELADLQVTVARAAHLVAAVGADDTPGSSLAGPVESLAACDPPTLVSVAATVMAISEIVDEVALALTIMTSLPERDLTAGRRLGDGLAALNTADAAAGEVALSVQGHAGTVEWTVRALGDPALIAELRSGPPPPPAEGNGRPQGNGSSP